MLYIRLYVHQCSNYKELSGILSTPLTPGPLSHAKPSGWPETSLTIIMMRSLYFCTAVVFIHTRSVLFQYTESSHVQNLDEADEWGSKNGQTIHLYIKCRYPSYRPVYGISLLLAVMQTSWWARETSSAWSLSNWTRRSPNSLGSKVRVERCIRLVLLSTFTCLSDLHLPLTIIVYHRQQLVVRCQQKKTVAVDNWACRGHVQLSPPQSVTVIQLSSGTRPSVKLSFTVKSVSARSSLIVRP